MMREIDKSSMDNPTKKKENFFSQINRHQKLSRERCGLVAIVILSTPVFLVGVTMLALLKTDIESARHQIESLRQLFYQQTPQSE